MLLIGVLVFNLEKLLDRLGVLGDELLEVELFLCKFGVKIGGDWWFDLDLFESLFKSLLAFLDFWLEMLWAFIDNF